MTLLVAILHLVNLVCAGVNGYFFMKAFRNPTVYPGWYCVFTGIVTLYCLMMAIL